MLAVALLLMHLGLGHISSDPVDTVDLIEVNVITDKFGFPYFAQLIFMNWDSELDQYVVVDWRAMKGAFEKGEDFEKEFDKAVQSILRRYPPMLRAEMRGRFNCAGNFIGGPWYPVRERSMYVCRFQDHDTCRTVRARSFREVWSAYDREKENQKLVPASLRSGLRSRMKPVALDPLGESDLGSEWSSYLRSRD